MNDVMQKEREAQAIIRRLVRVDLKYRAKRTLPNGREIVAIDPKAVLHCSYGIDAAKSLVLRDLLNYGIPVATVANGGCLLADAFGIYHYPVSKSGDVPQELLDEWWWVRQELEKLDQWRAFNGLLPEAERWKGCAVILEDVTTTGASALRVAEALRKHRIDPIAVVTLIDRDAGALQLLADHGVPLWAGVVVA